MRRLPGGFVRLPKSVTEPFANQRMGVERFLIGSVARRKQPHVTQPFDGSPPLLILKANEPIGQSGNRRLSAQRLKTVTARRAVEQPHALENGEQGRLIGEPFLLIDSITRRA